MWPKSNFLIFAVIALKESLEIISFNYLVFLIHFHRLIQTSIKNKYLCALTGCEESVLTVK